MRSGLKGGGFFEGSLVFINSGESKWVDSLLHVQMNININDDLIRLSQLNKVVLWKVG